MFKKIKDETNAHNDYYYFNDYLPPKTNETQRREAKIFRDYNQDSGTS